MVLGIALVLAGLFATIAGFAIVVLVGPDGSVGLRATRLLGTGAAITLPQLDVPRLPGGEHVTLDVSLSAGNTAMFVGVGPTPAVDAYLRGVPIDVIQQIDWPGAARTEHVEGSATATQPDAQDFWIVQATGPAPSLRWEVPPGDWTLVIMRADAQTSIDTTAKGSVTIPALGPIGFALLAIALAVLALGGWITVRAAIAADVS